VTLAAAITGSAVGLLAGAFRLATEGLQSLPMTLTALLAGLPILS
jgi:hypothetical protein